MTQITAFSNKSFHLLSFGCQMNARDSAWLTAALIRLGFYETSLEEAGLVILNTCSVREKAQARIVSTLRRVKQLCDAKIAVLGCVAQQCGRELQAQWPDVILVAGGDALPEVPAALDRLLETGDRAAMLEFAGEYPEKPQIAEPLSGGSAFVSIMQGCSNFCAYCIVPYTRGPEKCRNAEAIIQECEARLNQGAVEIVLLGQNVNVWRGERMGTAVDFVWLLQQLAGLDGLRRLRFITSHPRDLSPGLINSFAELKQLCPALHLPLQAGSDRVLARMGRGHTAAEYFAKVCALKKARPDIALMTDLIVGFPGETETDFQDTLAMMEKCGFVASYSFCYSDRPGTAASKMPFKISREESLERLARLQALQDDLTGKWLTGRVGETAEILIEGPSRRGQTWQGRDQYHTCVNVAPGTAPYAAGQLINAEITDARRHSLRARKI